MEQKKVVRKKVTSSNEGAKREKTAQELRIEAAVRKRREELANKKKLQTEDSPDPSKYSPAADLPKMSRMPQVNQTEKAAPPQKGNISTTSPASKFKKKETFEEKHNRVTTYINKEYHKKMNELRAEYRIPISETINKALDEYFMKHGI